MINGLKNTLPRNILFTLYNSLILPHLQYSILCWGFNAGRVRTLQKRAVRLITGNKYNAHTEPIFKRFGLLRFDDIFNTSVLKLYYKFKKGKLPCYLQNLFQECGPVHTYNTRYKNVHKLFSNRPSSEKCVRYYMPDLVKITPSLILEKTETHSPKGFSNYAKRYYLDSYNPECTIDNCYICNS